MQNRIPKIIHFFHDEAVAIWKKDKKPQFRMCYMSWLMNCPDYEIVHWHDGLPEFQEMLNKSKFLKCCYEQKMWAFVSDYVRSYALNKYGGIYLDTDVQLLSNFDKFLDDGFFISVEGAIKNGQSIVEPAVIGATSDNIILRKVLDLYNSEEISFWDDFMAPQVYTFAIKSLFEFERISFADEIKENFVDDDYNCCEHLANIEQYQNTKIIENKEHRIKIYPSEYFCPTWHQFKDKSITSKTVAIHWNQSSWWGTKEDEEKMNLLKASMRDKTNKFFSYTKDNGKIKIEFCGIKFTHKDSKFNKLHEFLYKNKKQKLFTHKYNCGVSGALTERSVELRIADLWLNENSCDYEIGAVSPYYWENRVPKIIDPADPHLSVTKDSLFNIDLTGKNVLCISTIEHIGTGQYGVNENSYNAIDALTKIIDETAHCLITFPIGGNNLLDDYLYDNYKTISEKANVLIYHRSCYPNQWQTINVENIRDEENLYGNSGANAVVIIEK